MKRVTIAYTWDILKREIVILAAESSSLLWVGAIAGAVSGIGALVVQALKWRSDTRKQEAESANGLLAQYERIAPGLGNVVKFYEESEATMREIAQNLRAELEEERRDRARCEAELKEKLAAAERRIREQDIRIAELERKTAHDR